MVFAPSKGVSSDRQLKHLIKFQIVKEMIQTNIGMNLGIMKGTIEVVVVIIIISKYCYHGHAPLV